MPKRKYELSIATIQTIDEMALKMGVKESIIVANAVELYRIATTMKEENDKQKN
jgi:hypothetical protein